MAFSSYRLYFHQTTEEISLLNSLVEGNLVCKHPFVASFSNICPVLQVRPARTRSARGPTVGWRLEKTVVPLVGANHGACHALRCADRRKLITLALGAFAKLTLLHFRVRFHPKNKLNFLFNNFLITSFFCKLLLTNYVWFFLHTISIESFYA